MDVGQALGQLHLVGDPLDLHLAGEQRLLADQGLAYAYPDMYWDPDYWGANRYL